jgi:hypothetical protein
MFLRALSIPLFFSVAITPTPIHGLAQGKNDIHFFLQDTLPPLHTIKEKDIDKITTNWEAEIITVSLKNGKTYNYKPMDWDYEDHFPKTAKDIVGAIHNMQKTFTRVEHPAVFPGGEEAFKKYLNEYCQNHKDEITGHGRAEFLVQFIVHLHGQKENVEIVLNKNGSDLSNLAIDAITSGPAWEPAVQNGRPVVSYVRQLITIGL